MDRALPAAFAKLRVLSLFAGIGGFDLGLERTGGFETVAFCEIEPFARKVLAKHWPKVPCYHDVRELTSEQLRADGISVDFICGGFPCQDISVANIGGHGLDGPRSGLFFEVVRLIGEMEPRGVLLENVANLLGRGLGDVLGALASIGYDAEWHCIPAANLGASHIRDRVWILAYPQRAGREGPEPIQRALGIAIEAFTQSDNALADAWRVLDGDLAGIRGSDGVPVAMERRRIGQLGNAVVPQIPELIGNAILASMRSAEHDTPPTDDCCTGGQETVAGGYLSSPASAGGNTLEPAKSCTFDVPDSAEDFAPYAASYHPNELEWRVGKGRWLIQLCPDPTGGNSQIGTGDNLHVKNDSPTYPHNPVAQLYHYETLR